MHTDMDDWYPYHASDVVIAGIEKAQIEPAVCRIGQVLLANGEHLDRGKVVAIWGRDLKTFRSVVKKRDRIGIAVAAHNEEIDLAALKAPAP